MSTCEPQQVDRLGRSLKATFLGAAVVVVALSVFAVSAIDQLTGHVQRWLWTDRIGDANSALLRSMEAYAENRTDAMVREVAKSFTDLEAATKEDSHDADLAAAIRRDTAEASRAFQLSVKQKQASRKAVKSLRTVVGDLSAIVTDQINATRVAADDSARRSTIVEGQQRNDVTALRSLVASMNAARRVQAQVRWMLRVDSIDSPAFPKVQSDGLPPVCDKSFSKRFRHLCVPSSARLRNAITAFQTSEPGRARAHTGRRVLQASSGFLRALRGTFEKRSQNLESTVDAVAQERITALELAQRNDFLSDLNRILSDARTVINRLQTVSPAEISRLDDNMTRDIAELYRLALNVFDIGRSENRTIDRVNTDLRRLKQTWVTAVQARRAEQTGHAAMRAALARMNAVATTTVMRIRQEAEAWIAVFTSTTIVVLLAFGVLICGGALLAFYRIARPISKATETLLRLAKGDTSDEIDRGKGGKALVQLFDALEALRRSAIARVEAETRAATAARDLEQTHARLATIADTAPVALYEFLLCPDGTMEFPYRSAMFDDLFGIDDTCTTSLPTLVFEQRCNPDDVPDMLASIEASKREMRPWRMRFRIDHPVRGQRWLLGYSSPKPDPDGNTHWTGTLSDVTEEVRYEEELEAARSKAEAANHAKSSFLANMSHEIRTPMNGIIGMCELLRETDLSEEQGLCARTIGDSANSLLTIINDVLDFSKVEAGRIDISPAPFNLYDLIFDVCRLLTPNAREKGFEILVDFAPSIATSRVGDYGRIRQILLNIVGNAVKFTDSGFVMVKIDAGTENVVDLIVEDTGVGIPTDDLDAIFNAFEQVDNERTREHDGTGLGLAITQRLIDLMGGHINVESCLGSGSTFTVRLPLAVCTDDTDGDALPDLMENVVLIVEKNETNREILVDQVIALGGIPVPAGSQAEALQLTHEPALQPIDIAILDASMTDREGDQLASAITNGLQPMVFPILLHAPFDYAVTQRDLLDRGYRDSLTRPTGYLEVARAIMAVLGNNTASERADLTLVEQTDLGPVATSNTSETPQLRVLAADDNRTNQLVLRKMLAKENLEIEVFQDGQEILEAYCAHRADLILMDLSMPRMDGLEATRQIRCHEELAGWDPCPIIALTANALAQHREACEAVGMDGFLTKPLRKKDLLAVVAASAQPDADLPPAIRLAG